MSDKPNDSSASSSIQENDDSGRDSIDSKKVQPPRIPKVKFTCDGDSSSSPSDSTSSIEYVFDHNLSKISLMNNSHWINFLVFFFFVLVQCVGHKTVHWMQ